MIWQDIDDWFWGIVCTAMLIVAGAILLMAVGEWTGFTHREFKYKMTGEVTRTILEKPEFVVRVWHHHPGDHKNGKLSVYVNSNRLAARQKMSTKYFSFESWSPNEENAAELRFDLSNFDDDAIINVEVGFEAPYYKYFRDKSVFRNGRWQ